MNYRVPKNLLSFKNSKTIKGEKLGIKTAILYLSPYTQNSKGINLCSHATEGCAKACLFGSGAARFSGVQAGKLNKTEYDFTMNVLTHTDFLIFNKSDKSPVLAVEVDGYEFHANNPKQLERDEMKDNILKKYDIPILRIKTNESGEETKLYNKLIEILKVNEQN